MAASGDDLSISNLKDMAVKMFQLISGMTFGAFRDEELVQWWGGGAIDGQADDLKRYTVTAKDYVVP